MAMVLLLRSMLMKEVRLFSRAAMVSRLVDRRLAIMSLKSEPTREESQIIFRYLSSFSRAGRRVQFSAQTEGENLYRCQMKLLA